MIHYQGTTQNNIQLFWSQLIKNSSNHNCQNLKSRNAEKICQSSGMVFVSSLLIKLQRNDVSVGLGCSGNSTNFSLFVFAPRSRSPVYGTRTLKWLLGFSFIYYGLIKGTYALTYNISSQLQWLEVSAIKIVLKIAQQTSLFSIFPPSKVCENWDGKYPKSNFCQWMECGEMSNSGEL